MNSFELDYHWQLLEALDPDQLVADLEISSEELLEAFRTRAIQFIEKEYG